MGKRGAYRVLIREPEGRNHFQDQGVDGLKMLKWMFKESFGTARTGLILFRIGNLLASQEGLCYIHLSGLLAN
jgi:hypothetical protein